MKRKPTAHRLYGAVEIDGNIYRVKTTIKEDFTSKEAKVPHSYEVLLAGTLAQPEYGSNPNTNNSISGANLLKNVEKSYDKGKKLLEESER